LDHFLDVDENIFLHKESVAKTREENSKVEDAGSSTVNPEEVHL